jgi:hypothetical protein
MNARQRRKVRRRSTRLLKLVVNEPIVHDCEFL